MRIKLKFSVIVILAVLWCGFSATAQEEGQSGAELRETSQHAELNLNDDKPPVIDIDVKTNKAQIGHEVNAANSSIKAKSESQNKPSSSEKTEEDPLSFNFLYFIIQKFKISDIVDD